MNEETGVEQEVQQEQSPIQTPLSVFSVLTDVRKWRYFFREMVIVLGIFIWWVTSNASNQEKKELKNALNECQQSRIKDAEWYKLLIQSEVVRALEDKKKEIIQPTLDSISNSRL